MSLPDGIMNGAIHKYVVTFIVLGIMFWVGLQGSKENNQKVLYCFVAVILGISIFFDSVVPFWSDYTSSNIISVECVYVNNDKTRGSRLNDSYSVKLILEDQEILLRTIPWTQAEFPFGEYYVRAYYLPNAKKLIFIEILNLNEL